MAETATNTIDDRSGNSVARSGSSDCSAFCVLCRWFQYQRCHRFPPSSEFPKVAADDWCGEFEYDGETPAILAESVHSIGLPVRQRFLLSDRKINTVYDVAMCGRWSVRQIKGIGPKTIAQLDEVLKDVSYWV